MFVAEKRSRLRIEEHSSSFSLVHVLCKAGQVADGLPGFRCYVCTCASERSPAKSRKGPEESNVVKGKICREFYVAG